MSNEAERLLALMANAKILIDFNSNTDILPSSKLEAALKDAQFANEQGKLEFSSIEAEDLRAEVQRMVSAIKPSTIVDVKDFTPYTSTKTPVTSDFSSRYLRLVRPILYSVSTAIVIYLCAYLTIWARDAEQFMRVAQNVQQRLASEALQAIVGRWTTVPFIELAEAGPWEPSDLRDSPRDFRAMAELLSTFEDIELKTNDLSRRLLFDFGGHV